MISISTLVAFGTQVNMNWTEKRSFGVVYQKIPLKRYSKYTRMTSKCLDMMYKVILGKLDFKTDYYEIQLNLKLTQSRFCE